MKLIAAVDKNWAIGKDNKLLAHIPEDMKFFRQMTTGCVVIMGRKTLESFPGKRPLSNRVNLVLSKNMKFQPKGARVVHDLDELSKVLTEYAKKDIYCIGGESIYRQLAPLCDEAYITKINYVYEADAYFPNLDDDPEWMMVSESDEGTCFDLEYRFYKYERIR